MPCPFSLVKASFTNSTPSAHIYTHCPVHPAPSHHPASYRMFSSHLHILPLELLLSPRSPKPEARESTGKAPEGLLPHPLETCGSSDLHQSFLNYCRTPLMLFQAQTVQAQPLQNHSPLRSKLTFSYSASFSDFSQLRKIKSKYSGKTHHVLPSPSSQPHLPVLAPYS